MARDSQQTWAATGGAWRMWKSKACLSTCVFWAADCPRDGDVEDDAGRLPSTTWKTRRPGRVASQMSCLISGGRSANGNERGMSFAEQLDCSRLLFYCYDVNVVLRLSIRNVVWLRIECEPTQCVAKIAALNFLLFSPSPPSETELGISSVFFRCSGIFCSRRRAAGSRWTTHDSARKTGLRSGRIIRCRCGLESRIPKRECALLGRSICLLCKPPPKNINVTSMENISKYCPCKCCLCNVPF